MFLCHYVLNSRLLFFFVFMIAMFKLFYNTIAACQRPVGPLLSNKCMYVLLNPIDHTKHRRMNTIPVHASNVTDVHII